ncbi:MAG TPA: CopG family transcriptional regulator [Nitrospiraceae bacterium]|nr:CopG family transcriptional regulator [Nitrospiraceae bacterium]
MGKTVTIRLDDEAYKKIKNFADAERRPISNFIESAALSYIKEVVFTDELEMAEILSNKKLLARLRKGSSDAKAKRGQLIG